jgi:hypothetical protein
MTSHGEHIMPSEEQQFRAVTDLGSDWLAALVSLDLDDRREEISEMAVNAASEKDKEQLSVLKVLLNADDIIWFYIGESYREGPESRFYGTAHWLIANEIAKLEVDSQV